MRCIFSLPFHLSPLSFSVLICACMCVPMCTPGGRRRTYGVLFNHSHPYSLEIGSLCEPEVRLVASEPSCLCNPHRAGVTHTVMSGFLHGCWGFERRSSCLQSKHLTLWIISPRLYILSLPMWMSEKDLPLLSPWQKQDSSLQSLTKSLFYQHCPSNSSMFHKILIIANFPIYFIGKYLGLIKYSWCLWAENHSIP